MSVNQHRVGWPGPLFRGFALLAILACLWFLAGCPARSLKEPIGKFQQNLDASGAVIARYYQEMNSYERARYLEIVLYDPELEVGFKGRDKKDTPLLGAIFSGPSIKARLDAVYMLGLYAQKLAALAGNEASAKASQGVQDIGSTLKDLPDTFKALAGEQVDVSAKDYIVPVTTVAGFLLQIYMEGQRDQALAAAIQKAAPAVNRILDLLEDDLQHSVARLRKSGALQSLSAKMAYYNQNRKMMPLEQRRLLLAEIDSAAQAYEVAQAFSPTDLVRGMRQAHQALLKYATATAGPQDQDELLASLEVFAARVKFIQAALAPLHNPN